MDASSVQGNAAQRIQHRAQEVRVPTFIANGVSDEISPAAHASLFIANLPPAVPRRHLSIDGEGHVFHRLTTWSQVIGEFGEFAREHLELAAAAARRTRVQASGMVRA